jgi:uncharacterized membrane protein
MIISVLFILGGIRMRFFAFTFSSGLTAIARLLIAISATEFTILFVAWLTVLISIFGGSSTLRREITLIATTSYNIF